QPPTLDGGERVYDHEAAGIAGLFSVAGTKYTTARAVAERIVDRLASSLGRPRETCGTASTPLPHVPLEGNALLRHAATSEMVCTLADAVVRRTTLGALGCPDAVALDAAANVVGDVLGWTAARRREEIAGVRRLY
ncbi:MAG: glycerol-3-phosphate dehydrogenase C-terminal domain-containing protein, partial [Vicinamibacterales bacterium]